MRILITGCGGMLGDAVYNELKDKYMVYATDINLCEEWLHYLDVRSFSGVRKFFDMVDPSVVIHLAALTDMEYCELNPKHAYDVNFVGTHNLMQMANRSGVPFVYISSAGVFNGERDVYIEGDIPNPLNVYAASKFAGELACINYSKTILIRAGWMMGGGPMKDKKFINKIIKQIRNGAKELFVVNDKLGTPTYTLDLARAIHGLIKETHYGTFHRACYGGGTRVDITREVLTNLNIDMPVTEVGSDYFSREYFVKRPRSEKLMSFKLGPPPSWEDCLQQYLEEYEWKV